jgi:hypothetical protein
MRPAAAAPPRGAHPSRVRRPRRRRRRRLNIRPSRPAPATTPSGLVQARGRRRATSWRQPDGAPGGPAVAGRPYQAWPLPGAVVARTGTGISHRRRRRAVPGRRYPGSRAGNPARAAGPGPGMGSPEGRLMAEAWSCGVPGRFAGRGGCRWRAEVPGRLGRAWPGRGRGTLDSVRIRGDPPDEGPGPRRPGGRSSGFSQGGPGCA